MSQASYKKILEHPDCQEIISKLLIGVDIQDINDWLKVKYSNISENKFILGVASLKAFKTNHLDLYLYLQEDFAKTKTAIVAGKEDSLELSVKGNSAYKNAMMEVINKEIDIKTSISVLCNVVETRLSQIYDVIQQDPRDINSRTDRVLLEYVEKLGNLLEKAYKIINNAPDQIIQHNVTVQHIDQHIAVFYDVIKEVLSQMDLESSMYFMELFNDKISKIKDPANMVIKPGDERLAEVKILNDVMNKKLNETL